LGGASAGIMKVSIPPRFGVSAAAGTAMVATQGGAMQRAALRPNAASPDVLIICFLLFVPPFFLDGYVEPSSGSAIRRNVRRSTVEPPPGPPVTPPHLDGI